MQQSRQSNCTSVANAVTPAWVRLDNHCWWRWRWRHKILLGVLPLHEMLHMMKSPVWCPGMRSDHILGLPTSSLLVWIPLRRAAHPETCVLVGGVPKLRWAPHMTHCLRKCIKSGLEAIVVPPRARLFKHDPGCGPVSTLRPALAAQLAVCQLWKWRRRGGAGCRVTALRCVCAVGAPRARVMPREGAATEIRTSQMQVRRKLL